jgi:hypothetical protein
MAQNLPVSPSKAPIPGVSSILEYLIKYTIKPMDLFDYPMTISINISKMSEDLTTPKTSTILKS